MCVCGCPPADTLAGDGNAYLKARYRSGRDAWREGGEEGREKGEIELQQRGRRSDAVRVKTRQCERDISHLSGIDGG